MTTICTGGSTDNNCVTSLVFREVCVLVELSSLKYQPEYVNLRLEYIRYEDSSHGLHSHSFAFRKNAKRETRKVTDKEQYKKK
jgi:hypothetical protein